MKESARGPTVLHFDVSFLSWRIVDIDPAETSPFNLIPNSHTVFRLNVNSSGKHRSSTSLGLARCRRNKILTWDQSEVKTPSSDVIKLLIPQSLEAPGFRGYIPLGHLCMHEVLTSSHSRIRILARQSSAQISVFWAPEAVQLPGAESKKRPAHRLQSDKQGEATEAPIRSVHDLSSDAVPFRMREFLWWSVRLPRPFGDVIGDWTGIWNRRGAAQCHPSLRSFFQDSV